MYYNLICYDLIAGRATGAGGPGECRGGEGSDALLFSLSLYIYIYIYTYIYIYIYAHIKYYIIV